MTKRNIADHLHTHRNAAAASTLLLLVGLVHAYPDNGNAGGLAVLGASALMSTVGLILALVEANRGGWEKPASLEFVNMLFILTVSNMAMTLFYIASTVLSTTFAPGRYVDLAVILGAFIVVGQGYMNAMKFSKLLALIPQTVPYKGSSMTSIADRIG
jgi:lysylphosphatidylglycerol synthetase-like protein (DUF2156 family)